MSVATVLTSSQGASKTAPAIDPAKPFDLWMVRDENNINEPVITYRIIARRGPPSDFFSSAVSKGIRSGTTLQSIEGFILSAVS